jgi:hypothetical protein
MLRDRPLAIEASIHYNTWLSVELSIYNDGEPIEEGSGGGLRVSAYCLLCRSKCLPDLLQAQRYFTFSRENVREKQQYFARCNVREGKEGKYWRSHSFVSILDSTRSGDKVSEDDGSIEVKVLVLAKEASDTDD